MVSKIKRTESSDYNKIVADRARKNYEALMRYSADGTRYIQEITFKKKEEEL